MEFWPGSHFEEGHVALASGVHSAGHYSVRWDASYVASGIYYARFNVTDEVGKAVYEGE